MKTVGGTLGLSEHQDDTAWEDKGDAFVNKRVIFQIVAIKVSAVEKAIDISAEFNIDKFGLERHFREKVK